MSRIDDININKKLLIIFFPITIYILIGTVLFFILSRIEAIAEDIGEETDFPFIYTYEAIY